ncbi:MAG TPA: hypothetical protein VHC97_13045 [Thermoanaerobaculia bacterium]|jgi:hypothetical protein|nr:hypothetical protein [Thermoanaerobaculia bacterium]
MMMNVALALAAVSTLVSLICFAALTEMFKNLEELQKLVDYNDAPKELPDVRSALLGRSPSQYGLPSRLDGEAFAAMLLISPRCHTCARVAAELSKGGIPRELTVVVTGAEEAETRKWLQGLGLSASDVILDHDYQIVNSMALYTTPSLVRIVDGRFAGASTIPSYRALRSVLDEQPPKPAPVSSTASEEHGGTIYVATSRS